VVLVPFFFFDFMMLTIRSEGPRLMGRKSLLSKRVRVWVELVLTSVCTSNILIYNPSSRSLQQDVSPKRPVHISITIIVNINI